MFGGFTDEARAAVSAAQDEAKQLGRGYVGAEHILLGLLRREAGVAAQVLMSLGMTSVNVRARLLTLVPAGKSQVAPDAPRPGPFVRVGRQLLTLPFTPRAQSAMEMSVREALTLGSGVIGTEHVLLGISRDPDSVAMRILVELDAELPRPDGGGQPDRAFELEIRNAIIRRLSELPAQA